MQTFGALVSAKPAAQSLDRRYASSIDLGLVTCLPARSSRCRPPCRARARPAEQEDMMDYGAAPLGLAVTRDLAAFLAGFDANALPAEAIHAGRRGVLDWLGCALAGTSHKTVQAMLPVMSALSSGGPCRVIGTNLTMGPLEAALANGQMGHVLDYDDTHMGGVVLHASSPVLSALFALTDKRGCSGRDFLAAYAAGFEAGVRTGRAAPRHHDGGWHLTGTLGTIAAGAAAARLLGLNANQMTYALGFSTTQACGMQQNRGTSAKSFHAGKAGSNGLLAAALAEGGLDSSPESIEGKLGFARIYSTEAALDRVCENLGQTWEITGNGFKPYACGVVLHPLIDATIAVAAGSKVPAAAVDRLELTVNPIAVRITGIVAPGTGLQSKFSVAHSAAVAFIDRAAGIQQYSDTRFSAADVLALRERVKITPDPALRRDEAHATVVTTAGDRYEAHVAHATGTVDNPMSDAALEAKFLANAEPVIGPRAREVVQMIARIETLPDVRALLALCCVK
jgi:2-methylcitrate dehydratase PrpD